MNVYAMCCRFEPVTLDDGQRNCPKHVVFYSKNKFEKLVHPVGFIIRIYHNARTSELQIPKRISDKHGFRGDNDRPISISCNTALSTNFIVPI